MSSTNTPDLIVEGPDDPVILEAPAEPRAPMGALAQFERNVKIVNARMRRTPWSAIAAEHNLTPRRCQQIYTEWRATNPTLRTADPMDIVDELLLGYQATLEDLERAATAAGDGTAVQVGALNAKLRVYREMAELLQAINVLPRDLGKLTVHLDGQVAAERVIAVLERAGMPEEVFDEILNALGGPPTGTPIEPSRN